MSKKILIYGLAFASPVAAAIYMYFANHLYAGSNTGTLALVKDLIIPAAAIILFLLSLKRENPEAFTVGKGIFGGFMVSVIVSCGGTLMYAYILRYHPEWIGMAKQYVIDIVKKRAASGEKMQQPLAEVLKSVDESFSYKSQFILNLSMAGSVGLFVGGITSYIIRPKQTKV